MSAISWKRLTISKPRKGMDVCHQPKLTVGFRDWEYETKLRDEWGFRKNLQKSDWQILQHHISKRRRNGKESQFLLHGVPIPQRKLDKNISRYRGAVNYSFRGRQFSGVNFNPAD
jgi:hypothetical protein